MKYFLLLLTALQFCDAAFATGSVTTTRVRVSSAGAKSPYEIVTLSWTADSSDGSVPNTYVTLNGYLMKVVTHPGAVQPTANYDMILGDPVDTTHDAVNSTIINRSASVTQSVMPTFTSQSAPILLAGRYLWQLTNNSVNSAVGSISFYLAP